MSGELDHIPDFFGPDEHASALFLSLIFEIDPPQVVRDSGEVGDSSRSNVILEKSYRFAVDAGKTALMLCKQPYTYPVGQQLLRSSSSVGANVEEANGASSPRDFAAKIGIALKEARESRFWVRLTHDLGLINEPTHANLLPRAEELVRILAKIRKTTLARYPK